MNRDGSQQRNLAPDSDLAVGLPAWSPDGQQILFHASKGAGGPAEFVQRNTAGVLGAAAIVLAIGLLAVLIRRSGSDRRAT